MKKLITATALISGLVISPAKALDGEIIFRDAMYGTAIGAVGGLALYAIDNGKNFSKKIGTGVLVGLIFGVGVGIFESQTALVEINNGKMHAGIPEIEIKKIELSKNVYDTSAQVNLLGMRF